MTPPSGTEADPSHGMAALAAVHSEQLFRAIFEQAAVGIALIETPSGRFLCVNQRYCEIVGLSPDEMTATTFMAITHPDDLQADLNNMEQLKSGHIHNFSMEKRYFRSDGSVVWVELTVSPMWSPGEQPTFHIAVVQDITERKQAQAALRMTEGQLTEILKNSAAMVFLKDPKGRYLLVNHAFEQRFGVHAGQVLGKTDGEIFSASQAVMFQTHDQEVMESGMLIEFEEVAQYADGEHTSIVIKFPLRNAENSIYGIGGIVTDITDRKRAERNLAHLNATLEQQVIQRTRELEESRQQLQAIVDGTSDAVFVKDLQGRYRLFNKAAEGFVGKRQDEVLGNDDRFLFSLADAKALMEADCKVFTGGMTMTYEDVATTADGVQRTFLSTKGPLLDGQGHVTGLFGISRDITERKQSEERFRAFLENSAVIAWLKDEEGRHVFLSENYEKRFGARLLDWRGKTDFEVWPREIAEEFRRNDRTVLAGPGPIEVIERAVDKHGNESWWLNHKFSFTDSGGMQYVGGLGVDITDRRRIEQALRESEERFRSIFEHAGTGIAITDLEGRFLQCNPAYCELLGYTEAELRGLNFKQLVHPSDLATNLVEVDRLLAQEVPFFEIENRSRHKDGHDVWVHKFVSVLRDDSGKPATLFTLVTDITEQRRAQELLEQRVAERTGALRASEVFNREILDSLSAHVAVLDASGVIVAVNRVWERAALCNDPSGLAQVSLGANYVTVCERAAEHSPEVRQILEGIVMVLAGRKNVFESEYLFAWPGYQRWFSMRVTPFRDRGGCVIVHEDVTDRKRAEEALRDTHVLLHNIINATPDLIFVKDQALRTVLCNNAFAQAQGKTPDELIGHTDIENGWDPELVQGNPQKGIRGFAQDDRDALSGQVVHNPYDPANVNGEIRIFDTFKVPLPDAAGSITGVLGVARDITERKQVEDALRDSYHRLQGLSREVQIAKEGERSRLSRELHDEFGQVLSGLKLELTTVAGALSNDQAATAVRMKMKRAIGMVDRLFVSLRELVSALRPSVLDELGLVPALEAFAADVQEQSGLQCRIVDDQYDCHVRCGPEVESALFRIAQELLTNVLRHAKATTATITLGREGEQIVLTVRDNGRGFDVHRAGNKNRFGLRGVQERAELLGGTITIDSTRKVGTTVTVRIPIGLPLSHVPQMDLGRPLKSTPPSRRPRRGH